MVRALAHAETRKTLGAFYTPREVAEFLAAWAIRTSSDLVLDPSFGGGVFLEAAADRIRGLGGSPANSVWGVELDGETHAVASTGLAAQIGLSRQHLLRENFFAVRPPAVPMADAVVGNPPYVRYQRFAGEDRQRATDLLARHGIRLSDLASSWAPFLVHSTEMLRPGGRLGMVIPMELCHASYARQVLSYLAGSFRRITFLTFRRRLFPDLSQDTLLLLGDDRGTHTAELAFRDFEESADLKTALTPSGRAIRGARILRGGLGHHGNRLIEQFLPSKARDLYAALKAHASVSALATLADVGIGYVTGANDYFHLSSAGVAEHQIADRFLRAAVLRGRAFGGLAFGRDDWVTAERSGDAGYLLSIPTRSKDLSASVAAYVAVGERAGVQNAFKCRVRAPWYTVPHVHVADAFITYMSGKAPRFVTNDCAAVAPNTLHVVRLHPISAVSARALGVGWQSSLTRLSTEVEGHPMGGGMLKLEPSEAGRVMVARPTCSEAAVNGTFEVCDRLMRHGGDEAVQQTVDKWLLQDQLGLDSADCRTLRLAAKLLTERRYFRSGK